MGSDPNSSPRYYYVYNGHGDVVALVDASGNTVASYSYDAFGQLTSASENFGGDDHLDEPLSLRRPRWGALRRRDRPLLDERPGV